MKVILFDFQEILRLMAIYLVTERIAGKLLGYQIETVLKAAVSWREKSLAGWAIYKERIGYTAN